MKKLYNKMINTMNSVSRKAVGTVNTMAFSVRTALSNTRGEGYIDTAVKILIAVVLGALLLAGLYTLFGDTVLPTVTQRVEDMFNYTQSAPLRSTNKDWDEDLKEQHGLEPQPPEEHPQLIVAGTICERIGPNVKQFARSRRPTRSRACFSNTRTTFIGAVSSKRWITWKPCQHWRSLLYCGSADRWEPY